SEKNRTKPDNPGWYGLCHGWAAAAISFKEPSPITMRNRHGLSIPFGSSDIKALLTYAHQDRQVSGHTDFLGLRCEQNEPTDTPQCKGVNAGSFHIILANKLGLGNQPFIMDMSRNYQVWNQPVYGYAAEIVDANAPLYATAAPGTTRVVKMR